MCLVDEKGAALLERVEAEVDTASAEVEGEVRDGGEVAELEQRRLWTCRGCEETPFSSESRPSEQRRRSKSLFATTCR